MAKVSKYLSGLLALLIAAPAYADNSALWGQSGESWTSSSRLPDFSKAGYRGGEVPIPDLPVRTNVRNYGALGDGRTDDSQAFLNAIAAASNGAVLIPAGRYVITKQLKITKNNLVLRGEGQGVTVLYFPKSLTEAVGPASSAPGDSWSWSGGFIYFTGSENGREITAVTAARTRGANTLAVASTANLSAGQLVRLVMTDSNGSLGSHLFADQVSCPSSLIGERLVDFPTRIKSISGNQVTLDRPLRVDVRTTWQPTLFAVQPSLREVGVESMTIEFPPVKYAGHHYEPGYNAVEFEGITDGWARNLKIINADSGIFFRNRSKRCTIQSVHFTAGAGKMRTGYGGPGEDPDIVVGGHHGLLADGQIRDILFSDFTFDYRFVHDLSVSSYSSGNVFSKGRGMDLNVDHHRQAPFENLFTEIDVGQGSRFWGAGGDQSDGPPAAARETLWNVRSQSAQRLPSWAIQMNVVGMTTTASTSLSTTQNWFEAIAPQNLVPANLYEAQFQRAAGSPSSGTQPPSRPRSFRFRVN